MAISLLYKRLPFLVKPTLRLALQQDQVHLHPSTSTPTDDPLVQGTVLLSLPRRRAIRLVQVVLEGLCDCCAGGKWPYESTAAWEKMLELDLEGQVLEAGEHTFEFSCTIPSTTAVSQRSIYGRVRHYVKASVHFASAVHSRLKSPPIALWLTANPASPGELPNPLEQHIEYFSPELGPLAVIFSSPHLTTASLVRASLTLFAPPARLEILDITAFVSQSFTVFYTDPSKVARPPARHHYLSPILESPSPAALAIPLPPLPSHSSDIPPSQPPPPRIAPRCASAPPLPSDIVRFDPTPLIELAEGTEYRWKRIFRTPNDDHVRPSTLPGTQTRIRVANTLNVEVHYRTEGAERYFTIGKPVVISACCCLLEALLLPLYVPVSPTTVVRPAHSRCLCNLSLAEMCDRDGLALERAETLEAPSERIVMEREERKSPSEVRVRRNAEGAGRLFEE